MGIKGFLCMGVFFLLVFRLYIWNLYDYGFGWWSLRVSFDVFMIFCFFVEICDVYFWIVCFIVFIVVRVIEIVDNVFMICLFGCNNVDCMYFCELWSVK